MLNYLLKIYDHYLQVGGYPEAVKAFKDGLSYSEIIDEIMGSLAEDFERKEEYQPALFNNVINAISNYIGSPSKLTHIDSSKYHANLIIKAMKEWHIILEVQQNSLDPFKSKFLPKRYLHDTGVINRSRTLTVPPVSLLNTIDPVLRTPLGGLFENVVLINLLEGTSIYKKIGA